MAGKVFVTSDLHFNHDRAFVYVPRGFKSVDEMNKTIIDRWNSVVDAYDEVYILGDLMLGDNIKGMALLHQLRGRIHVVLGNHDTVSREFLYDNSSKIVEVVTAARFRYGKYYFYLSHFPMFTGCLEKEELRQSAINLFGHTHSKSRFYNDIPFMYNVAVDAHDCYPVLLDDIIKECEEKFQECKEKL